MNDRPLTPDYPKRDEIGYLGHAIREMRAVEGASDGEIMIEVLSQIARQLARIADALEDGATR